jgi:hypothetical protein
MLFYVSVRKEELWGRGYEQAMERYDIFFNVLGRSKSQNTNRATTPQTIVQVA